MDIRDVINDIYAKKKHFDSSVFMEEELNFYEKKFSIVFPEAYRKFLLSVDPDIEDFYFTVPERHPVLKQYLLIAKFKDYDIAFDRKHNMKVVYLLENQIVEVYDNFLQWIVDFWEKENKNSK
ncbi:MAG: hypothetical protein ACK4UJ_04485 [Leptonema sp. (in: bacteria)]